MPRRKAALEAVLAVLARPRILGHTWLAELDGLRALAALSVVFAHYNPAPLVASSRSLYAFVRGVDALALANLGVVFFFTLSAFLLTYLGVKEFDAYQSFDIKKFYLRRIFRIWPLYFVVLYIDLFFSEPPSMAWVRDHVWTFVTFLSNWSLVFNGVGGYVDHTTPPLAILWSIAVEEQFYLFFPLLLFWALGSRKHLRVIVISLVAVGVVFRFVFRLVRVGTPSLGPAGGMYYATPAYSDVFLAGGVAGWFTAKQPTFFTLLRGVLRRWWSGIALVITIASLGKIWQGQLWYPYAAYSPLLYGATGIAFSMVILWTMANRETLMCRFLRSSLMSSLGTLSYGIYLWHPICADVVRLESKGRFLLVNPDNEFMIRTLFLLYIALTVACASLSYVIIERPVLDLKDHLFSRGRASRAPHSVVSPFRFGPLAGISASALLYVLMAVAVYFGRVLVSAAGGLLVVMLCWLWTRKWGDHETSTARVSVSSGRSTVTDLSNAVD